MDGEFKLHDFVNVSLRIKPSLSPDSSESPCLQVISKQPAVLLVLDRSQTYHFDNIFTEEADQETVYNETVKPLVDYVKRGYSCTVFAYGQTGTGKTYTMGTSQVRNKTEVGLIPRALKEFFTDINDEVEVDVSVSFIEIYNEKVFDLLQNNNKPPLSVKGFQVQGFRRELVYNYEEARHFLEMGNRNRHTSETKQNSNSSRSHAIFTIHCNVRHKNHETTAKLNLVDLAGCESVKKTGNQGSTFQEGVNINKGLLCIGQVMTALSTNSSFVPYRQSIITTILQDSLNGKNFVSLIACVNATSDDCNETLQTLEFAQRAKRIRNKPEVTEAVTRYKKDHPEVFQTARTSCTPFKKPYRTPYVPRRPKNMPLGTVREPPDSPKSLSSISISSGVEQGFSPVVRRYVTAMEESLVERIERIVKNTLERPKMRRESADKENDSTFSSSPWNRLENKVSKLVRNELVQLTMRESSPIKERSSLARIRKVLGYESPPSEATQEFKHSFEPQPLFKVPSLPLKRKTKRSPSISPVEVAPRRSARLSTMRWEDNDPENDVELSIGSNSFYDTSRIGERRRSVRLAEKRRKIEDSFDVTCSETVPMTKTRKTSTKSGGNSAVKATPARERLTQESNVQSPATMRSKHVLSVLKEGSRRELETLHLIGPKTAQQILLFREIKGGFNAISDLSSMPGWSGRKFEAFVARNFIKNELV